MEDKLKDETTYKRIQKDPTREIKDEITKHLRDMKEEGEIDNKLYLRLLPTKTQIPRMYGLQKIHKENYPLREIVDGNGGVTKDIHKYISSVIKQYVGKSDYYVKNSKHFIDMVKKKR